MTSCTQCYQGPTGVQQRFRGVQTRKNQRRIIGNQRRMFSETKEFNFKVHANNRDSISYPAYKIYQGTQIISSHNAGRASGFTESINNEGGDIAVTFTSPRDTTFSVIVDGKLLGVYSSPYVGSSSNARGSIRIPILALFPPVTQGDATPEKPRYQLKSPVQQGTYLESVQELTPKQVADYRNRGFMVNQTTLAISPAIKVLGNPKITTYSATVRMPRRGLMNGPYVRTSNRDLIAQVMAGRKSQFNPRRIFAEPRPYRPPTSNSYSSAAERNQQRLRTGNALPSNSRTQNTQSTTTTRPTPTQHYTSAAERNQQRLRGGSNSRLPVTTPPATQRNPQQGVPSQTTRPTRFNNSGNPSAITGSKYTYIVHYSNGRAITRTNVSAAQYTNDNKIAQVTHVRVNGGQQQNNVWNPSPTSTLPPNVTSPAPYTQSTQNTNQEMQSMRQELINLKAWLSEVNTRLSGQTVDLGQSTTDRDKQIQHLAAWSAEQNERVSQQLIDLGNAQTEAQKHRELIAAQKTVDTVKAEQGGNAGGGGSWWDGLTSWGSNIQSYFTLDNFKNVGIMLVILFVGLILVKKGFRSAIGSRSAV